MKKQKKRKSGFDLNRVVFLLFPATFFMLIFLTYPFVLVVYLSNLILGYLFVKKLFRSGVLWKQKNV